MRILAALDEAIRAGELQPGERLPPQRSVAEQLGIDFTTVTRAYAAARSRGLIEGAVGRGTFVKGAASDDEAGAIDLTMNLPPPPLGVSMAARLRDSLQAILVRTDVAALMAYHPAPGSLGQRLAGAAWLAPCLGEIAPERMLVCSGAQTALAALLGLLAAPGDCIVAEPLTYPGLRAAAEHLRLKLAACPVDGEGLVPEALERLCAERRPAAIYCTPTMQNPTAKTMGLERRREIGRIATVMGVPIIEDDAYGRLPGRATPAIAALAPEAVFHLATLSKCLTPGLRIAFVTAPSAVWAERLAQALRAASMMPAPLMAAVASAWIREGQAEEILVAIREEARARRDLARAILPAAQGDSDAIHLWLEPPAPWDAERLRDLARGRGLALVTGEAFAIDGATSNGLRIALGAPAKRQVLARALEGVAALLSAGPGGGRPDGLIV